MSLLFASSAAAQTAPQRAFVRSLDKMMISLARESARDARAIRAAYTAHLDLLVLDRYPALERALWNGGLAPLPPDPLRFNLAPRLSGPYPIGEKDLAHQVSYIAARPATIGALLAVASRVTSGPLEITSLVRHAEYQNTLRQTNRNATTSVPMHTMGLAFDIALVNTPLETVFEIRDVLRQMRKAGDILFVGERKQLVFHVVPNPSRLGHFTQVYAAAIGAAAAPDATHVVAFSPEREVTRGAGSAAPAVTASVVAVLPAHEFENEWWAGDHAPGDLTIHVTAPRPAAPAPATSAAGVDPPAPLLPLFASLLAAAGGIAVYAGTREPSKLGLFDADAAA